MRVKHEMKKRQLPSRDVKNQRNSFKVETEVAVYNNEGGVDAVETACINSIRIGRYNYTQRISSWGREQSGIWQAGSGTTCNN